MYDGNGLLAPDSVDGGPESQASEEEEAYYARAEASRGRGRPEPHHACAAWLRQVF